MSAAPGATGGAAEPTGNAAALDAGSTASPGAGDAAPSQAASRQDSVRPVRRALVSVSDKAGAVELARRLAAAGVEADDDLLVSQPYGARAGAEAMAQLMAREPRPTAVFAFSDELAASAMAGAIESGLRVPEDVSVTGFDDGTVADALGITTVRQPAVAVGVRAGELLIEAVERFAADEVRRPMPIELLPVELVARSTTAPPVAD